MQDIIVVFCTRIKLESVRSKLIGIQNHVLIDFGLTVIVAEQGGIDKAVIQNRLMQAVVFYDLPQFFHHAVVITRHDVLIIADFLRGGKDLFSVRFRRHHGIQHADKFGRINGSERFGIKRHLLSDCAEPFLRLRDRPVRRAVGLHRQIFGIRNVAEKLDVEIRGKLIDCI